MLITLSSAQMLNRWRLLADYEPLNPDCVVTRSDGLDLNAVIRDEMTAWYLDKLDNAPLSLVPVTDIASSATFVPGPEGGVSIQLPPGCRRVVEVQLDGWLRPATIVTPDDTTSLLRQLSPYTRAGLTSPVAIAAPGRLDLYPAPQGTPRIKRLLAVVQPADGSFIFDEKLLSTIISHDRY